MCSNLKCRICSTEYCSDCNGVCPECYVRIDDIFTPLLTNFLTKEIEKLKPKKDIFGLSKTNKAKIIAYNKVIKLIKSL